MQLISLELEAFLPFKEHIFLDFSVVNDDKIFLITGTTGAGKTSIFDAICFALYGEVSGSERDSTRLKSQFADDNTTCFVTLTFLNHGNRYKIRRTPIQEKLRTTGNINSQSATAILELENGEILSKKNEVDAKIAQILGINARQFKKIVMLPQGEFRKFLTDSSTDKQTLLRHIFATEYFDEFSNLIKERRNKTKEKQDHLLIEQNSLANQLNPLSNEKLLSEIKSDNKDFTAIISYCDVLVLSEQNDVHALRSQVKLLSEKLGVLNLPQAEIFNKKLSAYNVAKKSLVLLQQNSQEISADKAVVKKLFSVKEVALKKTQLELARKNAEEFSAAATLKKATAKASESHLEKAKALYNTAFSVHEKSSEKAVLAQKLEQKLLLFTEQKNALSRLKAADITLSNALKNVEMSKMQSSINENLLFEKKLSDSISSVKDLEKKSIKAQNDFTKWQESYNDFLSSQAYFLSLSLEENHPCPVCGSTTHPHPATQTSQCVITKKVLDQLSEKQEISRKSLEMARLTCSNCKTELNLTEQDFNLIYLNELLSTAKEKTQKLNFLIEGVYFSGSTLDELENEVALKAADKSAADIRLAEIKAKITENHLEEQELKSQIASIMLQIKNAENELSLSLALLEKTRKSCETVTADFNQTSTLAAKYIAETSAHKDEYEKLLEKYSLSEDELTLLSEKLLILDFLQAKIEHHDKSLAAMTQTVKQGKTEFENKSPIDLEQLKQEIGEFSTEQKRATKEYETAIKALDSNSKILKQLKKTNCDFEEILKAFTQIDMLYKVCSGNYGNKISFERYVLRSYFELVISGANDRLIKMTEGRYFLRRRGIKESGNTSSGLELEVFDSHCCKFRHVNSLSGGEGFKTSLCLALGLADVISQKSGGVELDTIFIDEGFGTLDPVALDSAIDCLYSLKNRGRTIGIISHVRELGERIPVKLNVFAGKIGSMAEFNIKSKSSQKI